MGSHSESEVLLVTDVPNVPSSIIMWATRAYGADKVRESTALTVLTDILQTGGKLDFENSSVNAVISLAETPGFHNWAWLLEVARVLKTGSDFRIQEPLVSRKPTDEERKRLATTPAQDKINLERSLLLAGFVNVETEEVVNGVGLSSEYKFITPTHISSINGPLLKPFAMKASKPTWDLGSTFAIKKKITYPRLVEQYTYDNEKDRHTEVMAETNVKCYKDVNVSKQIIHDQNDRYFNPCHRTYDHQMEAMVQTDYNKYSKDMLTGSDIPLQSSRGATKKFSPSQFPHYIKESKMNEDYSQSIPSNQYCLKHEEYSQPMPNKRTFKLDLSSVCVDDDSFELDDDDEAFTDEDNNSSIMYHESSTCHASKKPCRYCLGRNYEFKTRQQQIDHFSPWGSGRIGNNFSCAGCAICSKSLAIVYLEKASRWIAKYPYKLCKVLAIQLYHWCQIEGKHLYKEIQMLTTFFTKKLQELIIHLTPCCQSFVASSSSWPIVGLFFPNQKCKSIHVDKATQACFQNTRRPSYLHGQRLADTCFTS